MLVRWTTVDNRVLVHATAVSVALATGLLVVRGSQETVPPPLIAVVGLLWLVAMVLVPARVLLLGWIALMPLLEPAAADASPVGRVLVWALYVAPVFAMGIRTVIQPNSLARRSLLDLFPAAFVAYVVLSTFLASNGPDLQPASIGKILFLNVAFGAVVYYFVSLGPGAAVPRHLILATVMAGGALQGLLAIVDSAGGWNIWHADGWRGQGGISRAVSTLANPGVLGLYLGTAIVVAVAVLVWGGPRSLRRLALATIALATPGLLLTVTRGPILATVIVVTLLLALGRARIVGWLAIGVAAATIVLVLPQLQDTTLYQERVVERTNIGFRVALQELSLQLAEQKPVFGWGYGSFDTVKNAPGVDVAGLYATSVKTYTSHDTYLTMLVELGATGFFLFAFPFVVVGATSIRRLRARGPDTWVHVASISALGVCALTSLTFDTRFFSVAIVLPWIFLGLARRPLATGEAV